MIPNEPKYNEIELKIILLFNYNLHCSSHTQRIYYNAFETIRSFTSKYHQYYIDIEINCHPKLLHHFLVMS